MFSHIGGNSRTQITLRAQNKTDYVFHKKQHFKLDLVTGNLFLKTCLQLMMHI